MTMMGMSPEQMIKLREIQTVTRYVYGKVTVDYKASELRLELTTNNPDAQGVIPNLLTQLSEQLTTMLGTFFSIEGEIIEIGKSGTEAAPQG